jgi:3-isopropylmalate/(R)-2-methylmalate dehydratase large subunit
MSAAPRTLFDKVWDAHVVADLGDGFALLHVDRHYLHDGAGPGLARVQGRGYGIARPDLTFATVDHVVSTAPGRPATTESRSRAMDALRAGTAASGIRLFDVGSAGQGIVHVIGPDLGLTLPGTLIVCADSHSCTHGGLGAIGFGIGATELEHVLATQTVVQRRPRRMRITFVGAGAGATTAKDMILAALGQIGATGGVGYAIEYAGEPVRALDVEARLTLCNLSIELGAKVGMVAPDAKSFAYLQGRPYAPKGDTWDAALADWRSLPSDAGAVFDREVTVDIDGLVPQVTWGTSPDQVVAVDGIVPDPAAAEPARRDSMAAALAYMDLKPGAPIAGTRIDRVFIGSCTNARLSDLRGAARLVQNRRVAAHVAAWVVPGSAAVKQAAEAEGLDRVFTAAGFEWREAGCSMCLAANGERVPAGERCVSTSNRNFVGRQGPGARTHLASPLTAAAAALAGHIVDPRGFAP